MFSTTIDNTPTRAARARRVTWLLLAIAVFGAIDLVVTVGHMRSHGMIEANPIVLHLVRWTNSAVAIGLYKLATVLVGAGLLHRVRHHVQAEIATWVMSLVFAGVLVQWALYYATAVAIDPSAWAELASTDPNWIALR